MNSLILNTETQEFIQQNLDSDIFKLRLKGSPFNTISSIDLIEQIEAKKKCKTKLPRWYNTASIYYPNKLNIEQTSSEISADYKSKLIQGKSIIDLTGGFGVDSFYFSKNFESVTHCEINSELSEMVEHNFEQLQVSNVSTITGNGIEYLKKNETQYDWIYIDPSRRHDSKGKVFLLKDCLPNVPDNLQDLFNYSNRILIKTSPLLDLTLGINELEFVKEIHIVAINNEVKELLWLLEKECSDTIKVHTANLVNENESKFTFQLDEETNVKAELSMPMRYLYEPNSAILKSGGFNSVANTFNLFKLHQHSHIYTSDELIDFPGRRFKIKELLPFNKKAIKNTGIVKANITTRNFPESVEQIRKKLNIKDGGNTYLFFTTNSLDEKVILVCTKVD